MYRKMDFTEKAMLPLKIHRKRISPYTRASNKGDTALSLNAETEGLRVNKTRCDPAKSGSCSNVAPNMGLVETFFICRRNNPRIL